MRPIQKIKIEINTVQLELVINRLENLEHVAQPNRDVKTKRSVLAEVYKDLCRKFLNKQHVTDMYSLSLSFYKAHYLEEFLRVSLEASHHDTLLWVANKFHQKLA